MSENIFRFSWWSLKSRISDPESGSTVPLQRLADANICLDESGEVEELPITFVPFTAPEIQHSAPAGTV
jgi:hypothetical protein